MNNTATIPGQTTTTGKSSNASMNNDQPPLPAWLFFIYCALIFFSVLTMALCAYAVHIYAPPVSHFLNYIYGALGFTIFCAVWTWLVCAALIVLPKHAPQFYYKWILLGVVAVTTLFWLIAWAMLAAWASGDGTFSNLDYGYKKRQVDLTGYDGLSAIEEAALHLYNELITAWKCVCAASAFGAVVWALFVVVLVMYSIGCHQYRTGRASGSNVEAGMAGGVAETKPNDTHMNNYQSQTPGFAPTPTPEYQQQYQQQQYQQQQYAQSGVSTYVPTPNPEHQLQQQQLQQQQPVYQQPAPQQYVNPQFSETQATSHEMPTEPTA